MLIIDDVEKEEEISTYVANWEKSFIQPVYNVIMGVRFKINKKNLNKAANYKNIG